MYTKQYRFDLVQLIFNYIFRVDSELDNSLSQITQSTDDIDLKTEIAEILEAYQNYKSEIETFLVEFGWSGTPILSRAILIVFCHELARQEQTEEQTPKLIAEYLHLTQDLAGTECVPLVHAVMGKLTKGKSQESGSDK